MIDLHCDTISRLYFSNNESELYSNDFEVDIKKLKKAKAMAQFFAIFIDSKNLPDGIFSPSEYAFDMIDTFYQELNKNSADIALATNYDEYIANKKSDKISAFLTLEDGASISNKLSFLRNFYRLGVRLVTLTWNYPNAIGFPGYLNQFNDKGITEFGLELINEMNSLGMLIDVSHLSDKGIYDVLRTTKQPIVASHSNARFITKHTRNLKDDMIKGIADKGGVIGINFCSDFLGKEKCSSISNIILHIKHIKNVGGINSIALGTDYDGIGCDLEICNIGEMQLLFDALSKAGFSNEEIEKIAYKNVERIIKEVL